MKYIQMLVVGIFAFSAATSFAEDKLDITKGSWSWSCSENGYSKLEMSYIDSAITDLKISGYKIKKDGKQLEDKAIGRSVFDVAVGEFSVKNRRQLRFDVQLSDYSDRRTWEVTLIGDNEFDSEEYTFEASLISTFQSSDGDDMLHPSVGVLTCTAIKK